MTDQSRLNFLIQLNKSAVKQGGFQCYCFDIQGAVFFKPCVYFFTQFTHLAQLNLKDKSGFV